MHNAPTSISNHGTQIGERVIVYGALSRSTIPSTDQTWSAMPASIAKVHRAKEENSKNTRVLFVLPLCSLW